MKANRGMTANPVPKWRMLSTKEIVERDWGMSASIIVSLTRQCSGYSGGCMKK